MTQIDYYFTLNSPWSYMGSARLATMAKAHGASVACKPAKMGEVFSRTGGFPLPKRSPERQAYRLMELRRWTDVLGIDFVIEPDHFPHDEAEGVRLVIAAEIAGQDALGLATELGRALWELNQDPADADVQNEAAKRAGLDANALRQALSAEEAEDIWTRNTEEAISRGVFGAPAYVVGDEIFWGQDRLDFLERKLAA